MWFTTQPHTGHCVAILKTCLDGSLVYSRKHLCLLKVLPLTSGAERNSVKATPLSPLFSKESTDCWVRGQPIAFPFYAPRKQLIQVSAFFFFFFLFVVNFIVHWNETAMGLHVFRIPIPPPTSFPIPSLWVFPVHYFIFICGAGGKESSSQCNRHKRCRFDPWVGKIPWRRAQQPTPVFLPGESHGQRSLTTEVT